jgi:hypothetical protein
MSPFKDDLNERLDAAAKAKQTMLEKFRARQRLPVSAAGAPDAAAPEPVADTGAEVGGKAARKAGKARK